MKKKIAKGPQPFFDLLEEINERWVKADRIFGVPTKSNLSVTGQTYDELKTPVTPQPDSGQAFVSGLGLFEMYARQNPIGALYWHTEPLIERVPHEDGGYGYTVTMKLLISDNPVVPRLALEALQEL